MDALKGMDLAKLRAICRTVLADDEKQSESKTEERETKSEEKESQDGVNGWTPAESSSTFVFNIGASSAWPSTKPARGRPAKKEKSDA